MNQIEEEALWVRRTAEGDAAAFRALADAHLGKITAFAYRLLHDKTESEDVAQETFLRLWKDAHRYEPRASVSTWLHRIAHNLCVDRLRARRETTSDVEQERTSEEPGGLLDQKERASAVDAALMKLPERQRVAMTLVFYQELSNIEAADIMGISVDALESLLRRGRQTMREHLDYLNLDFASAGGGSERRPP